MSPAPERVLALFTQLGSEVGAVVDAGLDIDLAGGTSDTWAALLSKWGVAPLGEDARFEAAQADKMVKGAPVAEAQACVEAAVRSARSQCAQWAAELNPAQQAQLEGALASLATEAVARYRSLATARKKGMFAHAKATAQLHQYDGTSKAQGYVLHCTSCGAPRLGSDLTCAFCGGRVGA
jgi:hypothetical protein